MCVGLPISREFGGSDGRALVFSANTVKSYDHTRPTVAL